MHVPDVLYLTPVFKLKPMYQAVAAVFVSAHPMLIVLWVVFNFVASSIVIARSKRGMVRVFVCLILR